MQGSMVRCQFLQFKDIDAPTFFVNEVIGRSEAHELPPASRNLSNHKSRGDAEPCCGDLHNPSLVQNSAALMLREAPGGASRAQPRQEGCSGCRSDLEELTTVNQMVAEKMPGINRLSKCF